MIICAKEAHYLIIRRIQVKTDKKGQNEKTCALACLKETAAVETSSFILRFWVFLEHHFAKNELFRTSPGVRAWWEHFTVVSCVRQIRPEYTPWDMSVFWLMDDNTANLHLANTQVRQTPQAAVEHQLCLDFHENKGYKMTQPGLTLRSYM